MVQAFGVAENEGNGIVRLVAAQIELGIKIAGAKEI